MPRPETNRIILFIGPVPKFDRSLQRSVSSVAKPGTRKQAGQAVRASPAARCPREPAQMHADLTGDRRVGLIFRAVGVAPREHAAALCTVKSVTKGAGESTQAGMSGVGRTAGAERQMVE
jgi:hypothetical protein